MNGYPIEPSHLDLDVYRLLLPFAASRPLQELSDSNESDPLNLMRKRFERSEACRLLVTIAVTIRNRVEKRCNSLIVNSLDAPVGTLVKDIANPTESALSFRVACHKIIHASDIDFIGPVSGEEVLPPLSTQIKLSGEKSDRSRTTLQWEAILDVAEFARQAYKLI